jgi:hypothetical protein
VFSNFSDWENMKSRAVSSLECVSALSRSTWAAHEASGIGNWRIALPEVSPFRETQDPMVDARLDLLYKEAMDKLDEVDDKACMNYIAREMLACQLLP